MSQRVNPRTEIKPVLEHGRSRRRAYVAGPFLAAGVLAFLATAPLASSASSTVPVPLGTDSTFAVLAASAITNTGGTVISGNVGLYAGTSIGGFPPGTVQDGAIHTTDPVAAQAQTDLTTAINAAAGATSTGAITSDLAGLSLGPGVYTSGSSIGLSGNLTLDANGDPNAVFIFQAGSSLTVNTGSSITLLGGAQACNVFWEVGSSATILPGAAFDGNILARVSITLDTGATLVGSALASTGAVTLDTNTITSAVCVAPITSTSTGSSGSSGSRGRGGSGGSTGGPGARKRGPGAAAKPAKTGSGFTG